MKRPNRTLLAIHELGRIESMTLKYHQTGTDTADDFVTLKGQNGKVYKGKWTASRHYVQYVGLGGEVMELKPSYQSLVKEWKEFERQNVDELAVYERLKKKFEKD